MPKMVNGSTSRWVTPGRQSFSETAIKVLFSSLLSTNSMIPRLTSPMKSFTPDLTSCRHSSAGALKRAHRMKEPGMLLIKGPGMLPIEGPVMLLIEGPVMLLIKGPVMLPAFQMSHTMNVEGFGGPEGETHRTTTSKSGQHVRGRLTWTCLEVRRGSPSSQMMRGRISLPPSHPICTVSCCTNTEVKMETRPARRAQRSCRTNQWGLLWVPRMWPLR
jgi:hypothetical protein